MPQTLAETFRILTSFTPAAPSLANAPWDTFVDWAVSQGLAPLASYNLEFRLAGADAPEWARDKLLSVYQGSLNDNVMKMVNFRRAIMELAGCKVVLFGAASFLEVIYPHLAFRPVLDIELLVREPEIPRVIAHLLKGDFKNENPSPSSSLAATLSDGRTNLVLYRALGESMEGGHVQAIFDRASALGVYGPSMFRISFEDSALSACMAQSREAYDVPLITFVDLRELLGRVDATLLRETAKQWGQERALYASLALTEQFFPEVAERVRVLKPQLNPALRSLLEALVVGPVSHLGRSKTLKVSSEIRRLFTSH